MWYLRKEQLKGKIDTYVVVERRDLKIFINEMEESLSRLKLTKTLGIIDFSFKEILKRMRKH